MNVMEQYGRWLVQEQLPTELKTELISVEHDPEGINDRFYRSLAFGTGGLRGVIGAGTNRMNVYTVAWATQGLADYLLSLGKAETSVCIAYDTRRKSREFAQMAACVLCANGVHSLLFEDVRPTPMLSFAVRHKKADAGIVITASHNPRQYNGYKVYGPDGGQITDDMAGVILQRMNARDVLTGTSIVEWDAAQASGLLCALGEEVDAAYYGNVKRLIMRSDLVKASADTLKILYSPLHGAGNIPVRRVLRELGFSNVSVVPEQEAPDGEFPTTPFPNPEEPEVYALAIEQAKVFKPDLIFATDPDCDRIGVLVEGESGEFEVLSGNQVGALLCDYIISTKRELGQLGENPAIIKTIVTTSLADRIAEKNGVACVDTLTGFKYIGEKIGEWERNGEHTFLLGFEESFGYLAGDFVRDKDAVIAAALIAEMALYHSVNGRTLPQALKGIYETYGYTAEKLISVTHEGEAGQKKIAETMERLRAAGERAFPGENIAAIEDYEASIRRTVGDGREEPIALPKSNVIKYVFEDGCWIAFRPSGTEPKMKVYVGANGDGVVDVSVRSYKLAEIAERNCEES